MTPLEKRANERARKHNATTFGSKIDFKIGFKDFKDQPEVKEIIKALNRVVEEYSQDTVNEPIGSLIARIDNANHFVKEALKAWGEFVGDQALRGADEKV